MYPRYHKLKPTRLMYFHFILKPKRFIIYTGKLSRRVDPDFQGYRFTGTQITKVKCIASLTKPMQGCNVQLNKSDH
jgi:hypothetical protein